MTCDNGLPNSRQFRAVVAPGSRLNADFVLEAELDAFIADLNAGAARVALALVLLDQGKGSTKVLLQRTESPRSDLRAATRRRSPRR